MTTVTTIIMYVFLLPATALYVHLRNKGTGKDNAAVISKGLCTVIIIAAAVMAVINSPQTESIYPILIIAGLAMGLAGDIALCNNFVAGMFFFALGHLCYIPAFIILSQSPLWTVPLFVVLYLSAFILFKIGRAKPGALLMPAVVYSILLALMLSSAISVAIGAPDMILSLIVLSGALLFTLSDGLIAVRIFKIGGKRIKKLTGSRKSGIGTYCYFIAQSLLAVSIWLLIN